MASVLRAPRPAAGAEFAEEGGASLRVRLVGERRPERARLHDRDGDGLAEGETPICGESLCGVGGISSAS